MKIKNFEELKEIVADHRKDVLLRKIGSDVDGNHEVLIGMKSTKDCNLANRVLKKFIEVLYKKNIENVRVVRHDGFGCALTPVVIKINELGKGQTVYQSVDVDFVEKVIDAHFVEGVSLAERRASL